MRASTFWKSVTRDEANLLHKVLMLFRERGIRFCGEASDPTRRASKRQKDLADIARLIEAHPHLRARVPADLLDRLV